MSVRDHAIYEVTIEFTLKQDNRDQNGDHINYTKHPRTKHTYRLVAPKYEEPLVHAWTMNQVKFDNDEKDVKVINCIEIKLDAFIEKHTY